jgi:hypothetical protein
VRLRASVGSVRELLAQEVRAGERAATTTIKAETETLKQDLRRQAQQAFGARGRGIAFAWRSQVFPRSGLSLRPAGIVWSKVPAIIQGFDEGALIRPKAGKRFLAVPTGYNRAAGRRGNKPRVTPAQMVASRVSFVIPSRGGSVSLWCLPLYAASGTTRGRGGASRAQLIAGGIARVGTGKRRGQQLRNRALLEQGFVPMFVLLPAVKLPKRLDVARAAQAASRRIPGAFVAAWERESGRNA